MSKIWKNSRSLRIGALSLFGAYLAAMPEARATLTLDGVTNASAYTISPPAVFGGTAGMDANPANLPATLTAPFNTCANPPSSGTTKLFGCNDAAIRSDLILTLTFKTDQADGYPMLLYKAASSSSYSTVNNVYSSSSTLVTKGNDVTIQATWAEICSAMNQLQSTVIPANCVLNNGMATAKLVLAFSKDGTNAEASLIDKLEVTFTVTGDVSQNTTTFESTVDICDTASTTTGYGMCQFEVYPGDGKVALRNFTFIRKTTTTSSLVFKKLRVLWVKTSGNADEKFSSITSASAHEDLSFTDTNYSTLSTSRISRFDNDSTYNFKVALIDEAGNVGYYTGTGAADTTCTNTSKSFDCHKATPGEVVGVLDADKCFIATAAYGSPLKPQVATLRKFRDHFLLNNDWGRQFVRFYYRHSPRYADIIAENPTLKTLAQVALLPLIVGAWLFLKLGWAAGLALSVVFATFAFTTSFYAFRAVSKRRRARSQNV